MEKEIWKDVVGYEGCYMVSNLGRVKSLDRVVVDKNGRNVRKQGRVLCQRCPKNMYPYVGLSLGGVVKSKKVHRLVATTFIVNDQDKPCVNHMDCNKENNNVINLEWCTHLENNLHKIANVEHNTQRGEDTYNSKLKNKDIPGVIEMLQNTRMCYTDIGLVFGVSSGVIRCLCEGKSWTSFTGGTIKRPSNCDKHTKTKVMPTKVSIQDVISIRKRHSNGESQASLARDYNTSKSNVWYIVSNKTRQSIEPVTTSRKT